MIRAIIAVDEKKGVGRDGTIPWPLSKEDMRYFQKVTTGGRTDNMIVMGSKTWLDEAFPGPLPNRDNYIISSTIKEPEGATVISSDYKHYLTRLDQEQSTDNDIFIIGGASIINNCFDIIDVLYLTKIKGDHGCDVFLDFPEAQFEEVSRRVSEESGNTYSVYHKKES